MSSPRPNNNNNDDERYSSSSLTNRFIRGMVRLIGVGGENAPNPETPATTSNNNNNHPQNHNHQPHPHHHHHHVHSIRIGADTINRLFERYSLQQNNNQQQRESSNNIVIGPVYASISNSNRASSSLNNQQDATPSSSSSTLQVEENSNSSSAINNNNGSSSSNIASSINTTESSMDARNDSETINSDGRNTGGDDNNPSSMPSNTSTTNSENNGGGNTGSANNRQASLAVTMNLTFIHHPQNQNHHHHHPHHHHHAHHHHGNNNDMFGAAAALNPDMVFDGNFSRARQRVYSMLLIRIALLYSLSFPKFIRNFFEYSILLAAITCFALLIHMHVMFIRSPLTCLDSVKNTWPKHGILRVQIGDDHHNHLDGQFSVPNDLLKKKIDGQKNSSLPLTYEQYRQQIYDVIIDSKLERSVLKLKNWKPKHPILTSANPITDGGIDDDDLDESSLTPLTFFGYNKNGGGWSEPYMVEYSLEYGLLRLSEPMREYYGVPVMKVMLNPETDKCFGDMMARFMLKNFLGYDDVLIGSIKQLAEHENNRGFVRNVVTGEHFRFVNVWMTRTSYLAAAFIMMIFTLFVSMLIRYSHQQVFVFVSEFLRSLELQQPVTRISFLAASLITVILALIGMETIMYEFFADSSITFHVIIMVWSADQFDSLAIQSRITRRHFLRFFYLYQFIFYAYHYRFNGQYSGLALLTTILFTYHSMIFFFHHYELPVLRAAYVRQQQQFQQTEDNNNNQEQQAQQAQQQENQTATSTTAPTTESSQAASSENSFSSNNNNDDSGIDHSSGTLSSSSSSSSPPKDASTMTAVLEDDEPTEIDDDAEDDGQSMADDESRKKSDGHRHELSLD